MSNETSLGELLASWSFPARYAHRRTQAWYVGMGFFALVLLIYSVWTQDFLFGIIIILIGTILIAREYRPSKTVSFAINKKGIKLDDRTWPWEEVATFWVAVRPPEVSRLYFTFKSGLRPRLPIPLETQDPGTIKTMLLEYLPEHARRKDKEPVSEQFGRMLKM